MIICLSYYTNTALNVQRWLLHEKTSYGIFQTKNEVFILNFDFFFQSIRRAHVDVRPAEIFYSEGELHEANINRSPTSYLANPEEEREK